MCKDRPRNWQRFGLSYKKEILKGCFPNCKPSSYCKYNKHRSGYRFNGSINQACLSPITQDCCYSLSFTVFILFVEIIAPYKSYVKILKYLTLSLFAYIVTSIIVGGHWNQLVIASIVPHVEITPAFAMMLTIHKKAKLTWLTLASRPLIGILCPRTLVADSPLSLCYQQHSLPLYKTD